MSSGRPLGRRSLLMGDVRRALLLGFLASATCVQATPQVVRIEGSIFDSVGVPFSGNKDLQVKAYDAASGGTLLWTSDVHNATVTSSRFSLNLDAAAGSSPSLVNQVSVQGASAAVWFEIDVDSGTANGSMDSAKTMTPRVRARGTSFALNAVQADSLAGVTATVAEMNYLAGVTANIQTQINASSGGGGAFGAGDYRNAPTSGTLTGEYWTTSSWTTSGAITCNRCRLRFGGSVNINHAITVSTELSGGAGATSGTSSCGGNGAGIGFGSAFHLDNATIIYASGGGGGHGGAGGKGGTGTSSAFSFGGSSYSIESMLAGSSGAGGCAGGGSGAAGGAGGGSFYIEAVGPVVVGASISANGSAGTAGNSMNGGAGGGGSGGGVDIRSLSGVTVLSGITVSAAGGAGGAGVNSIGGGGGGGGGIVFIRGSNVSVEGGIKVNGGAAGANGSATQPGTSGSAGIIDVDSQVYGPRLGN